MYISIVNKKLVPRDYLTFSDVCYEPERPPVRLADSMRGSCTAVASKPHVKPEESMQLVLGALTEQDFILSPGPRTLQVKEGIDTSGSIA